MRLEVYEGGSVAAEEHVQLGGGEGKGGEEFGVCGLGGEGVVGAEGDFVGAVVVDDVEQGVGGDFVDGRGPGGVD